MAVVFKKDEVKVSKENGVAHVTIGNENSYFENTEISKQTLKDVASYNEEYLKGAVEVAKNTAKEIMQDDKDITKVVATTPYSVSKRGSINVDVIRSHTYAGVGERPDVTKSVIKVDVKDPTKKMSVSLRKEWEAELTDALLK